MTALAAPGRTGAGLRRLLGLGAARGAASLLGLLGMMLVARLLDPQELGRWSLALAAQGYALHLAELGLRSVATTELDRVGVAWPCLLRRYLALRLAAAAAVLAVVLGGITVWRPESLGLITLATLAILPIALQLDWIALVDDRLGRAALPLVLRPLAFVLLLAAWPGPTEATAVAGCYLAAWWLATASSWPALRRPRRSRPTAHPPSAGHMLARGMPLMLVTLTNQAQLSLDLLVVGWALGAARAGDYYLASQIAVASLLFANAANQLALARLPALVDRPERFAAELRVEAGRLARTALLLIAALAVLGPLLLPRLFGAEHANAAAALLWLLPWVFLQHLTNLLQGALAAVRRERAVLAGNLVLLAALVPALGLAAGAGTLAAFAAARSAAEMARLATLLGSLARQRAGQVD
jgi:O-antigen/teichoic acid export membrane protein